MIVSITGSVLQIVGSESVLTISLFVVWEDPSPVWALLHRNLGL